MIDYRSSCTVVTNWTDSTLFEWLTKA